MDQIVADGADTTKEELIRYVDNIVTTLNPAIPPDGSNADDAPKPKTNPHICNKPYDRIEDFNQDWQHLMKQTPAQVQDLAPFCNALHLYPTIEAVAEHNATELRASGQPIATIKAIHTGPRLYLMMQLDWIQLFA